MSSLPLPFFVPSGNFIACRDVCLRGCGFFLCDEVQLLYLITQEKSTSSQTPRQAIKFLVRYSHLPPPPSLSFLFLVNEQAPNVLYIYTLTIAFNHVACFLYQHPPSPKSPSHVFSSHPLYHDFTILIYPRCRICPSSAASNGICYVATTCRRPLRRHGDELPH